MALDAAAYEAQLRSLLPRGRAWTLAPGSVLSRVLAVAAAALRRVDGLVTSPLDEALASRALALLPEWETELGLPDACTGLGATVQERRAALLFKMIHPEFGNLDTFRAVARRYGATLVFTELDQAWADAIAGLDTTNGRWRYVWGISIPTYVEIREFTTLSSAADPLVSFAGDGAVSEIACRLRQMAPAHTHLIIGVHHEPGYLTWLGERVTWLGDDVTWL